MQRQFVERQCDYCGTKERFDKQATPMQDEAMARWVTLARELVVNDQPMPLIRHACRDSCAVNIIQQHMLNLPESALPKIDGEAQQRRHQN